MVATTDDGERLLVVRTGANHRQIFANRRHHLACLLEENLQQFLIDFGCRRVDQLHHLRGRCFGSFLRDDIGNGLADPGLHRIKCRVDRFQRRFTLLGGFAVCNQLGFLLQFLDRFAQLLARAGLFGLLFPVLIQTLYFLFGHIHITLGDGRLDQCLLGLSRFLGQAETDQRRQQRIARMGGALLQRRDVQPEGRNAFCHRFGIFPRTLQCTGRKLCHAFAQQLVERRGFVEFQDRQRALDLRKQRGQRGKFGGFLCIAKKCVERTFDGGEIDLHFLPHLEHQHALLRTLGHVVHQGVGAPDDGRQHRAGHCGFQARYDVIRLHRKLGGKTEVILQRGFKEQECRSHFERLHFGGRALHFAQMRSHRAERLYQLCDVLVGLLLRRFEQRLGLRDIRFQGRAISTRELEPILFLRLHLVAKPAHHAF